MTKEIIMFDSDEAASRNKIEGVQK